MALFEGFSSYSALVEAGLKGGDGAKAWFSYLAKLKKFRDRQSELVKHLMKKRPGMARYEAENKVEKILIREGFSDFLNTAR